MAQFAAAISLSLPEADRSAEAAHGKAAAAAHQASAVCNALQASCEPEIYVSDALSEPATISQSHTRAQYLDMLLLACSALLPPSSFQSRKSASFNLRFCSGRRQSFRSSHLPTKVNHSVSPPACDARCDGYGRLCRSRWNAACSSLLGHSVALYSWVRAS